MLERLKEGILMWRMVWWIMHAIDASHMQLHCRSWVRDYDDVASFWIWHDDREVSCKVVVTLGL
jgi:hypothetical protein